MKRTWAFIDETGVLSNDPQQPFFALGLLKTGETSILYERLNKISQRAKSKSGNNKFEFKFNKINNNNTSFYIDLIDIFFEFPDLYFKCLILNKKDPNINFNRYFSSTWEAQISYTKLLLKHTVRRDEQVAVIADYLGKPNSSTKFFEKEILTTQRETKNTIPVVFNACMLESDASLFIQLVDVLLGLVVYDCKIQKGTNSNLAKTSVLNVLKNRLTGIKNGSLCQTQNAHEKPYFGTWFFSPKK
jgi:Protein of unknown function (DUF3800)